MSIFSLKHAPKDFDDLTFADPAVEKRLRQYASNLRTKSIILHGPYGTGKSTIARLLVKKRDPQHAKFWMSLNCIRVEMDFFSPLSGCWNMAPFLGVEPMCILDEVDLLSKKHQFELRAFMDERGGMFVMTTNHLHAVDKSIKNRCDVIEIQAPNCRQYTPRAVQILAEYDIELSVYDFERIIADCENWRDVLSVIEDIIQEHRIGRKSCV